MRIIRLVLLLSLLAALASACGSSQPSLVGTWEGTYESTTITVTFSQDGRITMQAYGESSEGTYQVDLAAKPASLDLQFAGEEPVATIIEFVDANTLRMENNYPGGDRPTTFSDYLDLTRQQ